MIMNMGLLSYLHEVEQVTDRILMKWEKIMATAQDFKTLVSEINTETDRVAAKIQEIMDKVSSSGLSGAEEAEILGDLTGVRDRLATIGKDPANPIPPVTV